MEEFHKPVLLKEVIEGLNVKEGGKYIDATVGGGGHTLEVLKRGGEVLGIDRDPEAIEYIKKILKARDIKKIREEKDDALNISISQYPNITLVRGNFRDLKSIAKKARFWKVDGILFDLGVSTHQLEIPVRGFSFNREGPLDMRMDPSLKITAYDLVNRLTEGKLYEIFTKYGEENNSRAIARAIVRARAISPIKTCSELARIVAASQGKIGQFGRTSTHPAGGHPATRVFQALRMVVNNELENLKEALPQAVELLKKKGRLAVISFHSLEDRIVKLFFKNCGQIRIMTEKPARAKIEEIRINPRARSGKLRIGQKI